VVAHFRAESLRGGKHRLDADDGSGTLYSEGSFNNCNIFDSGLAVGEIGPESPKGKMVSA
jgi:hypothetical protein